MFVIINLRYFKEKTQVQVAKILGISQVQVSTMIFSWVVILSQITH